MPVPSTMGDLSVTESSNSPNGSDPISTGLDNYLRSIQSIIRSTNFKGPDIASAASVAIGASTGEYLTITGTTGITSFDSVSAGIVRAVQFSGALTITHSSNIQLPGDQNYTTRAGDVLTFRSLGSGQWKCVSALRSPGGEILQAVNSSALSVNNSSTLAIIPGCEISATVDAATYLIETFCIGSQTVAAAGVRLAVDATSGPTATGSLVYELSEYSSYNTTGTTLASSDAAEQANVTTANALFETSLNVGSSARFIIRGYGSITFATAGAAVIGFYAAQNVPTVSTTQISSAHIRLTKQG